MTTVIGLLLFLAPFYFNYLMRKVGAYKLFNMIQKMGFLFGFIFVTCRGAILLFSQSNTNGGLAALCFVSFFVHGMVSTGGIDEPYEDDTHGPH